MSLVVVIVSSVLLEQRKFEETLSNYMLVVKSRFTEAISLGKGKVESLVNWRSKNQICYLRQQYLLIHNTLWSKVSLILY